LTGLLDELFLNHTLSEWQRMLAKQTGPWTVVQNPAEVARDRQAEANEYMQDVEFGDGRSLRLVTGPIQFDGEPGTLSPAPDHGADTDKVLGELGFVWDEILQMKINGAII
jgi:crotonobetainyl-CoA:carnitine CoA-transferase CaiB-like acyl-CoA transferase